MGSAQSVSLHNYGDLPLLISYAQVSGDFILGNTCPASLAAGTECALQIRFAPAVVGVRQGLLVVYDSAPKSTQTLNLSGLGVQNPEPAPAANLPDLTVTGSATPIPAAVGGLVSYQLTVSNVGNVTASNVQLNDSLPAGMSWVYSSPLCNGGGNQVTCNLGNLAPGANTSVKIKASPTSPGLASNTARVTSATDDENEPNNSAMQQMIVARYEKKDPRSADVSVKLKVNGQAKVNEKLKYQMLLSNKGPANVSNLLVTSVLPSGASFKGGNGCVLENTAIVCETGSLKKGRERSLFLYLSFAASGRHSVTSQVHSTLGDVVSRNTASTATVKVKSSKSKNR